MKRSETDQHTLFSSFEGELEGTRTHEHALFVQEIIVTLLHNNSCEIINMSNVYSWLLSFHGLQVFSSVGWLLSFCSVTPLPPSLVSDDSIGLSVGLSLPPGNRERASALALLEPFLC